MEERKQRERKQQYERREMAAIINKDVEKFKEEAEQKKQQQLRKVCTAPGLFGGLVGGLAPRCWIWPGHGDGNVMRTR